jgi:SAM-dependent methyltransferase
VSYRRLPEVGLVAGRAYDAPVGTSTTDVVLSVHSLEHVVWPKRYLDEMIRVARVGGLIALVFPEFARRDAAMNSVRFGRSPGGLRQMIRARRWLDVIQTVYERRFVYPNRIKRLRNNLDRGNIEFLINPAPLCLVAEYQSDNDAVYFASEDEVANYLETHDCLIRRRSADVPSSNSGKAFILAERTSAASRERND